MYFSTLFVRQWPMPPSPSKRTPVRMIGRTSLFYHRNVLRAVPPVEEPTRPVELEKQPLFIAGNGTQAVPGDEGDAIQRAAQVSNLAGAGSCLCWSGWIDRTILKNIRI